MHYLALYHCIMQRCFHRFMWYLLLLWFSKWYRVEMNFAFKVCFHSKILLQTNSTSQLWTNFDFRAIIDHRHSNNSIYFSFGKIQNVFFVFFDRMKHCLFILCFWKILIFRWIYIRSTRDNNHDNHSLCHYNSIVSDDVKCLQSSNECLDLLGRVHVLHVTDCWDDWKSCLCKWWTI